MRSVLAVLLVAVLGPACGSDISGPKNERYFARAQSEVALVEHYIERYNWASAKAEEYAALVADAEERLGAMRGQLRDLRQTNDKRAKEIAGLKAESDKLAVETEKKRGELAAAEAALAPLEAEVAARVARRAELEKTIEALDAELAELEKKHPEARLRVDRLRRWLRE